MFDRVLNIPLWLQLTIMCETRLNSDISLIGVFLFTGSILKSVFCCLHSCIQSVDGNTLSRYWFVFGRTLHSALYLILRDDQRVKCMRIRSYSGPHFPSFRLNTEKYSVFLRIQSECGKMRTRITANTDTFYTVYFSHFIPLVSFHTPWKLQKTKRLLCKLREVKKKTSGIKWVQKLNILPYFQLHFLILLRVHILHEIYFMFTKTDILCQVTNRPQYSLTIYGFMILCYMQKI